jgi:hypothetical protein
MTGFHLSSAVWAAVALQRARISDPEGPDERKAAQAGKKG